ncbi:hypothetical protein [Clostridium sp. CF012]|uniref:hypothetical protein n=1 Tax=Clostridium sp. CF012 TaxID=2843319 RepID=UPI001C0D7307|nr:hypothetical protein [Clostridium sp. CF012]MBU3142814.1 hypothetical protein [Clostridium sp. CF012]
MSGYNKCGVWVNEFNDYITRNMHIVQEYLEVEIPEIKFTIPEATYLAWLDIRDLPYSIEDIKNALVNVGEVAIMSGSTYGQSGEGFLRINVGCSKYKLYEGLKRIKKAIVFLKANNVAK